MWKGKKHKDEGKLIKLWSKSVQPFLPWKKEDLWSFDGSATDPHGQEWWLLLNLHRADCSFRVQKQKHQGWKQAIKSNGYVVEVIG